MKNSSVAILLIAALFCIGISSAFCQTDEDANNSQVTFSPTKVDGLFSYILNEWLPALTVGTADRDTYERLAWYIASAERDFGDLPEFWEVAAIHPTDPDAPCVVSTGANRFVDREKLVYALESYDTLIAAGGDVSRLSEGKSSVLYAIGVATVAQEKKKQSASATGDVQSPNTTGTDATLEATIMVDYYQRAEAANPKNAFFPLYLGVCYAELGDCGNALKAFDRAGACEYFEMPRPFHYRYLSRHLDSVANCEGIFQNLKIRYEYLLTETLLDQEIPDFVALKRAFRTIIDNAKNKPEAKAALTSLHRAACALGKDREGNAVTAINASILISSCAGEALAIGRNTGDKNLELAALAVRNDADAVKHAMKGYTFKTQIFNGTLNELTDELIKSGFNPPTGNELAEIFYLVNNFQQTQSDSDDTGTAADQLSVILEHPYMTERHLYNEHFDEVFLRLQGLDYANPSNWYTNWLGIKMYLP